MPAGGHMKLPNRILLLLVTIALPAITAPGVAAQSREAELKGKMVGLFGQLVTWPTGKTPTPAKPLTIGIVGDDPFVDAAGVNHLEAKLAGTGAVVRRFPNAAAYEDCHVLVVSKAADFEAALAKTKGKPVLVVSEAPGLAKKGAVVNLVYDQPSNKIRLEINPGTARTAKLQINPGLLRSPLVDIVN